MANKSFDICYVLDCTKTMKDYIPLVKESITYLAKKIKEKYDTKNIRVAFIGFRDWAEGIQRIESIDFVDIASCQKFISDISPQSGGNICEDVFGGLLRATTLNWTSNDNRIVYCICRSPQGHPNDPQDYHKIILNKFKSKNIKLFFLKISNLVDKMVDKFMDECKKDDNICIQSSDILNMAYFNATLSDLLLYAIKYEKRKAIDFELKLNFGNNNIKTLKHKKLTPKLKIYKLKEMITLEFDDDNIPEISNNINLIFNNNILQSNKILADYRIYKNDIINVEKIAKSSCPVIMLNNEQQNMLRNLNDRVQHYDDVSQFLLFDDKIRLDNIVSEINDAGRYLMQLVEDRLIDIIKTSKMNLTNQITENEKKRDKIKENYLELKKIQNECINAIKSQQNADNLGKMSEENKKKVTENIKNKIDKALNDYKIIDNILMNDNKLFYDEIKIKQCMDKQFKIEFDNPFDVWSNDIVQNYDESNFENWKRGYCQPFSHKTTQQDLQNFCDNDENIAIFVGIIAKSNLDIIKLGAFSNATVLFNNTESLNEAFIPKLFKNTNYNIYWYNFYDKSFGFSPNKNICLDSLDTISEDDTRLCWYNDGKRGGIRIGKLTDNSDKYFKVIYYKKVGTHYLKKKIGKKTIYITPGVDDDKNINVDNDDEKKEDK